MAYLDPQGKVFLTHSPSGVRVEFVAADPTTDHFGKGLLELWVSPRAADDPDYRARNFSNRDDHTRLFDRIALPGLGAEAFEGCDYDPFHLVLSFTQGRRLHLVPIVERAAVALWCETPQDVDFKSDRTDELVSAEKDCFAVRHTERGESFVFHAALGGGEGTFSHQTTRDAGRSTYARARLAPGQVLWIEATDGDATDNLPSGITSVELLERNEAAVAALAPPVDLALRDQPELERLLRKNQRVLLAMQDHQGAIRAAINRIYYMIWVRDGAIIEAFHGNAGWFGPLQRWTRFLLANPTGIDEPGHPKGRSYTMLVNPITKWEEDGVFYAIWSAFNCWTQHGGELDAATQTPGTARILGDAMDWLERYCFDDKRGLFGRYFACETPLAGSRDFGYDNAVGLPAETPTLRWQEQPVTRSYDIYINQLCFDAYWMLAAMDAEHADQWQAKADRLAAKMNGWFAAGDELPAYGDLELADGSTARAGAYGIDRNDYEWALSVGPGFSEPALAPGIRRRLFEKSVRDPKRAFLAGYFSITQAQDPLDVPEAEITEAVLAAAAPCYRPGEFLAMPDTVIEMLNVEDGDRWHDIRPQAFSIGPLLATVTGLGLRRLPFGLALRPSRALRQIRNFQWQGQVVDVTFAGDGRFLDAAVNGEPLRHTWQLPESLLHQGHNTVEVALTDEAPAGPLFVSSTLALREVASDSDGRLRYAVRACGYNVVRFRRLDGCQARVLDSQGQPVESTVASAGEDTWLRFAGRGDFSIQPAGAIIRRL